MKRQRPRQAQLDPSGRTPAHQLGMIEISGVRYRLLPLGAWSSSASYVLGNLVTSGGSTYLCIAANTNETPPNATYWQTFDDTTYFLRGDRVWAPAVTSGGPGLLDTILSKNPYLFYKLNEASGSIAHDSSGNGLDLNTGSYAAPAWGQTAGPPGEVCALFTAADTQRLANPSVPDVSGGGADDFTVIAWFKYIGLPSVIVGQGEPGRSFGSGWQLGVGGDGFNTQLLFLMHNDSINGGYWVNGDNALTNGDWYMGAAVQSAGSQYLYLNGLQQTMVGTNVYTGNGGLWIGNDGHGDDIEAANGDVSYVAIVKRALSGAEILAIYNAAFPNQPDGAIYTADGDGSTKWRDLESSDDSVSIAVGGSTVDVTLPDTGPGTETVGDATHVAQITTDAKGRITGLAAVAITGAGGGTPDGVTLDTNGSGDIEIKAAGVGTAQIADGAVTEAKLGLSDVTTDNVSTSKHGLAPKGTGTGTKYLDDTGAYSTPPGGAGATPDGVTLDLNGSSEMEIKAGGVTPAQLQPSATGNDGKWVRLSSGAFVYATPTAADVGAVPTARQIIAGTGLSGGGDLTADRTLSLPSVGPGVTTVGDATHVAQVTTDAQGRITALSAVAISGGGGGSSSDANEDTAATLVGATSAGDAGGRSDQFTGSSLNAKWGNLYGTGVAAVVGASMLNFTNTAAANTDTGARQAYTPSGAFRIEARVLWPASTDDCAVEVTDSLTLASENTVGVGFAAGGAGNKISLYSRDAGTFTSRASITLSLVPFIVYLALARNGANGWTAYYSLDRNTWITVGTWSKTLTAAYIKAHRYMHGTANGGFDFIDVVS